MRASFAALVLLLLALAAWATWNEAFPGWRRYQRELVRREIARLETELAAARSELDRPGVRAEIARLEERMRVPRADSADARLAAAREELATSQAITDDLHATIRRADAALQRPQAAEARRKATESLEAAQEAYAAATGTWPPDTLALARLWAARDSLADALVALEGPIQEMRTRLSGEEARAQALREEVAALVASRDSLARLRDALREPVTRREAALARLRARPLRVREISSPDGMEVARCPTCHGSLDDPEGAHPALPAAEEFRDVPCTVCHGGRGRALDVEHAHRGLLSSAGYGAGPFSFRGRIAQLLAEDPREREAAREALRRIAGFDPAEERTEGAGASGADSAVAASWAEWWRGAEAWFEPSDSGAEGRDGSALRAIGIDPWRFSVRGRPLRYVGSRKCLSCHEVLHREHSRRWMATKFRSIERLAGTADPRPCLPCHTTGWDAATGKYEEPGVTCEGCHGPGERYNEMMVVGQEMVARGEETRGRALLSHSARLAREAASRRLAPAEAGENNVCVTCHHPRQHRAGCPGFLDRARAVGEESDEPDDLVSAR